VGVPSKSSGNMEAACVSMSCDDVLAKL
jgi:hypothetical protein